MFTFIPQTPCKYWGLSEFIRKRNLVNQIAFAYKCKLLFLKHANILA